MNNLSDCFQLDKTPFSDGFSSLTRLEIDYFVALFEEAYLNDKTIFIAGLDKDANIFPAWYESLQKQLFSKVGSKVRCIFLDVKTLFSVSKNDLDATEDLLSEQLALCAEKNDLFICMPTVANSPAVLKALAVAKNLQIITLCFVTHGQEKFGKFSDFVVHVRSSNSKIVLAGISLVINLFLMDQVCASNAKGAL